MARQDLRQASRSGYTTFGDAATADELQLGCMLRSADALEAMAKNYAVLIAERDRYERWYREEREKCQRMARRIVALRGAITRAKRRAANTPAEPKP